MLCDLASLDDIRRFVGEFRSLFSSLDVLVNNAGVITRYRQQTKDGYELQLGVNHLGHFLLTNLLLDVVVARRGRVVVVSSGAHRSGQIWFDDVNLTKNFKPFRAYSQSKLANILFTYELARRFEGTGATANCLHPGFVATNIAVDRKTGFGTMVAKIMKHIALPPEKGAETIVHLAASPEVEGISGKYFIKKRPVRSSDLSYSRDAALRLWELSEEMTGLR